MRKRFLFVVILGATVSGCSSVHHVNGTGNFYTLSDRNVIERDLTRPTGVNNEPNYPQYDKFPAQL